MNLSKCVDKIKRAYMGYEHQMKKKEIKLGDKIVNQTNKNKIGNPTYRVIGLNPNIKLQRVYIVKCEEELGEIIELSEKDIETLKPMFDKDHPFRHGLFGTHDMSYIWIRQ